MALILAACSSETTPKSDVTPGVSVYGSSFYWLASSNFESYSIERVNQPTTKCGTGIWQAHCEVKSIDFSSLSSDPDEAAAWLTGLDRHGAMVEGRLTEATLFVSEYWKPLVPTFFTIDAPVYLTQAIECPAGNCNQARVLNSIDSKNFSSMDFGPFALVAPADLLKIAEDLAFSMDGLVFSATPAAADDLIKLLPIQIYLPQSEIPF